MEQARPVEADAITEARAHLEQAITLLAANGKQLSAAHAQMALDASHEDSSRLDPKTPA